MCQMSPASSMTASTGTSMRVPVRDTAASTPTSPAAKLVRSSVMRQRTLPPSRDSSRMSVTTAENELVSEGVGIVRSVLPSEVARKANHREHRETERTQRRLGDESLCAPVYQRFHLPLAADHEWRALMNRLGLD